MITVTTIDESGKNLEEITIPVNAITRLTEKHLHFGKDEKFTIASEIQMAFVEKQIHEQVENKMVITSVFEKYLVSELPGEIKELIEDAKFHIQNDMLGFMESKLGGLMDEIEKPSGWFGLRKLFSKNQEAETK